MKSVAERIKKEIEKKQPKPRVRRMSDGGLVHHYSDGTTHISEMRIHNYLREDPRLKITQKRNPEAFSMRYKQEFEKMKNALLQKHPNSKVGA